MLAAKRGHKDIVLMLIERGANLNFVDKVSMYLFVIINILLPLFLKKMIIRLISRLKRCKIRCR